MFRSAKIVAFLICLTGPAKSLPAQVNSDSLWGIWNDTDLHDTLRMKAVQDMAWGILYSNPDSATSLAKLELGLARKSANRKWQGKALNTLGATDHLKGNYAAALSHYQHALTAFLEVGEKKSTASMYNNLGLIYREQGDYAKALGFYQKYLALGEELHDTGITANALNNLGILYSDQANFAGALEYYERALRLAEGLGDKSGMAIGYNNIGSIHFSRTDYPQALGYYERSIALRKEIGDQRGMASVYNNIGLIYKETGDYVQALAYHHKALEIQEKLGDKPGLAGTYYNIGSALNSQKSWEQAVTWCSKGLALSEQIGVLRFARHACHCLYEAHKAEGKPAEALRFHERYLELSDSLRTEETNKRLEQMEFAKQVMADSLSKEEEKLKMEMAYQKAVRTKNTWLNIALASGLFVLALAVGFWSRMLYFRRYSQMFQDKAEHLEKQQLINEIALLKTQVNPHFLFNSLSILSSLVRVNPDLSEQFIDQLSRSYRYILEQKEQSLVTLRTEMEFIRSYTFLLKIRFENKFDVRFELPEDVLDQYKIAPLTLQLLAENAVKHNRMSVREPLIVYAGLGDGPSLIVRNHLQPRITPTKSTGVGLQNIINRYALLTDRPVWAGEREDEFVVRVPLL
ncbi:MAG: tetratricopeptide repeat protein [Saprospiraceae bacterium]|jgi:tetratricopeptide (TPR) repeat protein|nr:tetratricopeptide repeat protein [Saprospiraceae bacterium]